MWTKSITVIECTIYFVSMSVAIIYFNHANPSWVELKAFKSNTIVISGHKLWGHFNCVDICVTLDWVTGTWCMEGNVICFHSHSAELLSINYTSWQIKHNLLISGLQTGPSDTYTHKVRLCPPNNIFANHVKISHRHAK